jgi:CRISPR-associated exonuclease Cas4
MTELVWLCVVVVALWLWARRARRDGRAGEEWLPWRLRGAELAYAERTFKSSSLKVAARLDRAYRMAGELTLVELKTRAIVRAYPSDVIELSAQRAALAEETGESVSDVAYVLIRREGEANGTPIEVRLLPVEEVARLVGRLVLVKRGDVCGSPATSRGLCEKCAYLQPCRERFGDR